jgi:plastocyanin
MAPRALTLMQRTGVLNPTREPHVRNRMRLVKWHITMLTAIVGLIFAGCVSAERHAEKTEGPHEKLDMSSFYLPGKEASRVVSVVTNATPVAFNVVVQTLAIATKEGGPKDTVARFGEVYAFSPTFISVHREEPVSIRFWNLQGDDNHDFMLMDPRMNVLMKVLLPPLKETPFVFTFHEEGLFNFVCAMHQPSMGGQILVLPPRTP